MDRRGASIAFITVGLTVLAGRCAVADPVASPSPSPSPQASDPCDGADRLLATANRPTIGFSACAVKKGTAVFELGYQNQVNGTPSNGSVQSQVPQTFFRVGAATRFELDVVGPNYVATRAYPGSSAVTHGVTDSGLGFKYELPPEGRWTLAFDGLWTSPNGSPFLTAGSATLTGNLDASFALSPSTSIGTTIAFLSTGAYENTIRSRYGVTEPSLVVTTQIPNDYQFYAEYVFVSKIAPSYGGRAFTDFGVQKLLGSRTEIDVEYGHAFTGDPALRFDYIGTGLVLQFW
ncbi:MAG: hypothetical protein WB609_01640 [Candidatus Cybelea sp.]